MYLQRNHSGRRRRDHVGCRRSPVGVKICIFKEMRGGRGKSETYDIHIRQRTTGSLEVDDTF